LSERERESVCVCVRERERERERERNRDTESVRERETHPHTHTVSLTHRRPSITTRPRGALASQDCASCDCAIVPGDLKCAGEADRF